MRPPGDVAFHRSRAAHYRAVLDGKEQDPYDNPDALYYFHLEQAGDWELLETVLTAALTRIRSIGTEAEFHANSEAFDLALRLLRCSEGRGASSGAKRWFGELVRFDRVLGIDRRADRWDLPTTMLRDPEQKAKISNMDREFADRGEIPLGARPSVAERMKLLGELAMRYDRSGEAEEIFGEAARLLEPYAFNVKSAAPYLLHDLYLLLRRGRHVKHLLMWLCLRDESFHGLGRTFLLGRMGLIAGMEGRLVRARQYFREAASFAEYAAEGERDRRPFILAQAVLLCGRASARNAVKRMSEEVIRELRWWYEGSPLGDWGRHGELLRRVMVAQGDRESARGLAIEMAKRYAAELPGFYEAVRNADAAGPLIVNPYLGLYFCRAFLGDYRGAVEALERAEGTFRTLMACAEAPWDEGFRAWKVEMAICQHLRRKTLLEGKMGFPADGEETMASFRALAKMEHGRSPVLEEELYEFQQLLTKRGLNPLQFSGPKPYVTIGEDAFLENLRLARVERSRPKDMDRALDRFRRRRSREGWSDIVLNELARVYREKAFDITAWPEEALLGFKRLVEHGRSLGIVHSGEFSERTIVAVLIATAQGVIDS